MRITAREANMLTEKWRPDKAIIERSDRAVDEILESVKFSALRGRYSVDIFEYGFADYDNDGLNKVQQDIVDQLREIGYRVEIMTDGIVIDGCRISHKSYLQVSW